MNSQQHSLKQFLPPDLYALSETKDYPSGTALFLTGQRPQWMFFILSGEVTLDRHGMSGQMSCLQRCQSGFVGEASLTSDRYHCDGRTTVNSQVTKIPIEALRKAIKTDTIFAVRWIVMLSLEVRKLRLQNERLSIPKVQDRLLHLIETEGVNGSYRLICPIKDIAKQLAVSHEALYRAIAHCLSKQLIVRDENSLTLCNH